MNPQYWIIVTKDGTLEALLNGGDTLQEAYESTHGNYGVPGVEIVWGTKDRIINMHEALSKMHAIERQAQEWALKPEIEKLAVLRPPSTIFREEGEKLAVGLEWEFKNGYGGSALYKTKFCESRDRLEFATLHEGAFHRHEITDYDVQEDLDAEQVIDLLDKIEALPPKEKR